VKLRFPLILFSFLCIARAFAAEAPVASPETIHMLVAAEVAKERSKETTDWLQIVTAAALAVMSGLFLQSRIHARALSEKRDEEINIIKVKMATLEANTAPTTAAYKELMVKILTHSHAPETDALLTGFDPDKITPEQERVLLSKLSAVANSKSAFISPIEKLAAKIFPDVVQIDRARRALGEHNTVLSYIEPLRREEEHKERVETVLEELKKGQDTIAEEQKKHADWEMQVVHGIKSEDRD
jgi:hypothetical protein